MDKKEKTLLILGLYKNEKDIVLLSIIFILLCSCKYLNAIRNLIHFKAKFHKGTSLINNVYYCRFKLILKSLLNWFKISRILNFKSPKNLEIQISLIYFVFSVTIFKKEFPVFFEFVLRSRTNLRFSRFVLVQSGTESGVFQHKIGQICHIIASLRDPSRWLQLAVMVGNFHHKELHPFLPFEKDF